jgi:hypothetical protein
MQGPTSLLPDNAGKTVTLLSTGRLVDFSSQLRDDFQPALLTCLSPVTGSLTTIINRFTRSHQCFWFSNYTQDERNQQERVLPTRNPTNHPLTVFYLAGIILLRHYFK